MKKHMLIDAMALLAYLVVANPLITGIALHEWLSLGLFMVFLLHCAVHYDWVVDVLKRRDQESSLSRRGKLIVDILLLLTFVIVMVSGLCISGTVLPSFGIYIEGYFFWDPLHAISAKVLLALIVVHVAMHWKWVIALCKKEVGAEKVTRQEKKESQSSAFAERDRRGVRDE